MILFCAALSAATAKAAVYTVTNLDNSGPGSLRQAVLDANATPDDDFITFTATGTIILSAPGSLNVAANAGKLTIKGPGADQLTISANNSYFAVFRINSEAEAEISGVTITGSTYLGIYSIGRTLTINKSNISGNSVKDTYSYGAGIFHAGGGTMTINDSVISNNSALDEGVGAGIFSSSGTMTINNSTISGNSAGYIGGGIYRSGYNNAASTMTINNSTISGNSASYQGGGIYLDSAALTLNNSIVANSTQGADCFLLLGTINASYSLIEDGSCGVVNGVNGNLTGDPGLGPLQNNGGPTFTHELLDGSPAIDAGSNDLIPDGMTNDQRGAGFPRIVNSTVDIGAFEKESTNSAPQAADDAYGLDEDDFLTFDVLLNDTDGENDPLTAVEITSPANGSLVSNPDGTFTYTPNADFNGQDSFTYKANDGSLDSNPATVTLTVSEINDSPVATKDDKSTDEDTPLNFNAAELTANDSAGPSNESGQTLSVTQVITTSNTSGQVVLLNGQINYQPDADFSGQASFDYEICDNGTTGGNPDSKCAIGTVNITVNPINDSPIAFNDAETVEEDGVLNIAAPGILGNDSDPENDPLTAVLVSGPANGSLTLNSDGSFSYTPNANFNGQDSFTYKANDGSLDSAEAVVSITINAVNDAPSITNGSISRSQGAGSSNSQIASVGDVENAAGSLSVLVNEAASAVSNGVTVSNIVIDSNGSVTADVAAGCGAANASFTLKVVDSGGLVKTAVLNVTVAPETEAPVINAIFDVVAYLPPNSPATSMIVNFPTPSASDNCDPSVTVTTDPASGTEFSIGETLVTVSAKDDGGNVSSRTFRVLVRYNFTGFFFPVNNDRMNLWKAGIPVPVRFSLSGDKGSTVYAEGSPTSQQISCANKTPVGAAEPLEGFFTGQPFYSRWFDKYATIWKTKRSWKRTCRQLQVTLNDGSTHSADFQFK